uniref:ATP synthase complex subunit 8 n=1 Tax=Geocalamus acutus TaxID=261498 RepID=A1IGI6_GEOAC|nr:ATPase subunit 8 [Geocalamus acutus]
MPQLNPAPWFLLLIFTWLTLMLYMMKAAYVTFYLYPTQQPKPSYTCHWHWPWL